MRSFASLLAVASAQKTMTTKEKLKADLATLYSDGVSILAKEADKKQKNKNDPLFVIEIAYQGWYSKASPVVQQVLPDRHAEFVELYQIAKRKQIDVVTYTIKDYLLGLQVTRGGLRRGSRQPFCRLCVEVSATTIHSEVCSGSD